MIEAILIPFTSIFFAELLDKSQLTILLLSTKTKKHMHLLLGVILAFVLVDGLAIFFGAFISSLIPASILRIVSGILFIIFGLLSFRESTDKETKNLSLKNPFFSALTLVFVTEWGDKTQLASAVFATEYPPIYVFIGVMAALSILSLIAIKIGATLFLKMKKQSIAKISGTIFVILGLFFLLVK